MHSEADGRLETVTGKQNWWTTLPGVLTGLAALLTAITGFYLAFVSNHPDPCKTLPVDDRPISCLGADAK